MTLGHLSAPGKDAMGLLFSGVGMYMSLVLATRFPNVGAINQFFNSLVAAAVGVGSVAAAVTIAWQKVLATSRGIRADLTDTKKDVLINKDALAQNQARVAALEREAAALRAKAAAAERRVVEINSKSAVDIGSLTNKVTESEAKVHTAHKLARQAINQATAEVSQIKAEAAAEIAALKKDLAQFHERYHDTVKVVNKLNLESEVREREARKSNDPDKEPGAPAPEPTHIIIDNIEKLAALDSLDSSEGIPVVVVDKPKPDPKAEP